MTELPFLDVFVERKDGLFITSIYCKPMFTGLYTNWNSFVPNFYKIGLISTRVHPVLMICSPCTLHQELEKIHSIFIDNGFLIYFIKCTIERKIQGTSTFGSFFVSPISKTTMAR